MWERIQKVTKLSVPDTYYAKCYCTGHQEIIQKNIETKPHFLSITSRYTASALHVIKLMATSMKKMLLASILMEKQGLLTIKTSTEALHSQMYHLRTPKSSF
jgi:hypothetical protein